VSRLRAGAVSTALLATLALGLGGCAETEPSAADEVPALAGLLVNVESAVVDGRYTAARRQLDALVDATVDALESGELDESSAEEILAAAAKVRALLPAALVGGEQTSEPKPEDESTGDRATSGSGGTGGSGSGGDGDGTSDGGKDRKPGKGHGQGGKGKGRGGR
jgi:hypothetical protein